MRSSYLTILACGLSAWLGACSQELEPATQIVLSIDSDLEPGTQLTEVAIDILNAAGDEQGPRTVLPPVVIAKDANDAAQNRKVQLPLRLAIVPGDESQVMLRIVGSGVSDDDKTIRKLVTQRAVVSFLSRKTQAVNAYLGKVCIDKVCDDARGEVCYPTALAGTAAGSCGPVAPLSASVTTTVDRPDQISSAPTPRADAGTDAGVASDGSVRTPPEPTPPSGNTTPPTQFVLGTMVLDPSSGEASGHLAVMPRAELEGARVELSTARAFPASGDFWVLGESIYVASAIEPSITRYVRTSAGLLTEAPAPTKMSFPSYVMSAAFANNVFVSPSRAYLSNGASQLIVWNPTTMVHEGAIDIPGITDKGSHRATAAAADRSSVVVGNKLYRPIYYSASEGSFAPTSTVAVIDIATNTFLNAIDVPCGGLDFGTAADDGQIFFSNWYLSVGGALQVEGGPATCFAQLDTKSGNVTTTRFRDITGGYEGAALRYLGDGSFAFVVFGLNRGDGRLVGLTSLEASWRSDYQLWSYRLGAQPTLIQGIEKGHGAVYDGHVRGQNWLLIPTVGLGDSTAYRIVDGRATRGFIVHGWLLRLFGYPS